MHQTFAETVGHAIAQATDHPLDPSDIPAIDGALADRCFTFGGLGPRYFVKTRGADRADALIAEVTGLEALRATGTVRVPAVIAQGESGEVAWLALEFLPLGTPRPDSYRRLGTLLAALHRASAPDFGFEHDNFIGHTPQTNPRHTDWLTFYREARLGYQLSLLAASDPLRARCERLLETLERFFPAGPPPVSLVHGDLWAGNHGFLGDGQPVVFDPAVYYGDRETDLAMTTLFGGFPKAFYDAYDAAWPRAPGHAAREPLYQLYHVLNHLHLFGEGYRGHAQRLLETLERLARRPPLASPEIEGQPL